MNAYCLFTSTGNEHLMELACKDPDSVTCKIATSNVPEISGVKEFSKHDREAIADSEIIDILGVRLETEEESLICRTICR